jgi:glycosyltransferase involved in cell wall biosynthesis
MPATIPAVSVLMPCYNAADTLVEALRSLERQSLPDFEVIVVEDGSSDSSPEILNNWGRADGRIHCLGQAHQGIIAALNNGLRACRSPLVARMDCDDRSFPVRLELQAAFLQAHPEVSVVGCLVAGFPQGHVRQGFRLYIDWLNSLVCDADIRREIFIESPLAHPSVMYRREVVLQAGGYQDRGWPEDYDLWLRLYHQEERFAKIPQVLLEWRERPERLTRTDSRYSLENFLRLKAHYLARGPLKDRNAVIIWGAGMMGRRLSKHLVRQNVPLQAFIDVDPAKIGRTRRGLPILSPGDLPDWWARQERPALLAAVGARGARQLIRDHLAALGFVEGLDWWGAA